MRRLAYSAFLAALVATTLATRVHLGFERIRFRVVTQPLTAADRSISVRLPDLSRLSEDPAAIIVRVQGGDAPADINIALDGAPVTRVVVAAQREIRVDATATVPPGAGHEVTLSGDRPGWRLTYLEIANVHGHSEGVLTFVIAPVVRQHVNRPSWPWVVVVGIVAFVLRPRPAWPRSRSARRWSYAMSGVAIVLFVTILLIPLFSRFLILLSLRTFAIAAALLYIDPLRHVVVAVKALRRFLPLVPHAAVVVVFLWGVSHFYDRETGFASFMVFGEQFDEKTTPALKQVPHPTVQGSGYDGQFYAQLALDPFVRQPSTVAALDDPAYRSRRVLFPLAAYVAGLGRPAAVLQVYALVNVIAWLILGWQLLRWLPPGAVRPTLAWAACMLGDGLSTSVAKALLEGPSLPLLAAAVFFLERKRHWIAALIVGLSGLARETNVLTSAMFAGRPSRDAVRRLALIALIVAAPLALWLIYLRTLGLPPIAMGGRNVTLPFVAFGHKWIATIADLHANGWGSYARYSLLALIAVTTQALTMVVQREPSNAWWRVGIAYAVLLPFLGPAVWEGYPGAFARAVLPLSVAFCVLLPRNRWFWPLLILGNLSVVHTLRELQLPWFSA